MTIHFIAERDRYEDALHDVRYALRSLLRTPGFTAVAVLTLALGIGATSAIFSVVDGTLLRPLPFPDPERLVMLGHDYPELNLHASVSAPQYAEQDMEEARPVAVVNAFLAEPTLGIAIGANSAVFGVVQSVLLEPLPFEEPDRLVSLAYTALGLGLERVNHAAALHHTFLDENRTFEKVGMWWSTSVSVTGREPPEEVDAIFLTSTTLPTLGIQPSLGRAFGEQDDTPGGPLTVILGNSYWQTRFGGDPHVIGQAVMVYGLLREIVGVMPAGLRFLDHDPAVYLPFGFSPEDAAFWALDYQGVARLRPGVTVAQANADVERMIPLALERFPGPISQAAMEQAQFSPRLQSLKHDVVGDAGNLLWMLLGAVGIVLLIAFANVANLFLVRASQRETEVAVRKALGASRRDLARSFLGESVPVALLGGAGGLVVAYGGVDLLHFLAPEGLPRLSEIDIRPAVLLFTLGLTTVVGVVLGVVPLFRPAPNLNNALKEGGGRGVGTGWRHGRVRDALVMAQIAFALVLLVGAGLMIRSLIALGTVRPGFERPEEVLTVRITIPSSEIGEPERVALAYEQMLHNLEAVPGVVSVGASTSVTLDGFMADEMPLVVEDAPTAEGQIPQLRRQRWVLPGYFETMDNVVLAGRSIGWADVHERAPVAVITENLAVEHWGSAAAAIGRRVRPPAGGDEQPPWREIVGVVGNVHDDGLMHPPVPTVYWPAINQRMFGQETMVARSLAFVIRTPGIRTAGFMDEVSAAIWSVSPNLPLAQVQTLEEILGRSTARTSFVSVMLIVAAAAALLLGAVGVYAVASYAVAQRRHELGVRMALGARQADIARLVLRRGLVLAVAGGVAGVLLAIGLTRLMAALLYGVSAVDPLTFTVMTLFVGSIVLLATWVPARRVARMDPMDALRAD